jgi:hypothetical protein
MISDNPQRPDTLGLSDAGWQHLPRLPFHDPPHPDRNQDPLRQGVAGLPVASV